MLENTIEINGEKLEILFLFNYKDRDFVVYTFPDGDISASIMKKNNDKLELVQITDVEDWAYVDQKIDEYVNTSDEN